MITGAVVTRTASGVTSWYSKGTEGWPLWWAVMYVNLPAVCCVYGSTMLLENWVLVKGEQLPAPAMHFGALKEGAAARFLSLTEPYESDQVQGDEMG